MVRQSNRSGEAARGSPSHKYPSRCVELVVEMSPDSTDTFDCLILPRALSPLHTCSLTHLARVFWVPPPPSCQWTITS